MFKLLITFFVGILLVPQLAVAACTKSIPYAVQLKEGKAEVNVNLLKNYAKIDELDVRGGFGFVKTAYSAAAQQAMSDILEYYCCAIEDGITNNPALSQAEKTSMITDVKRAEANMNIDAGLFFGAYLLGDYKTIKEVATDIRSTKRTADDPKVDLTIFDIATKIDLEKTFLQTSSVDVWIQANIASAAITACGGVAFEALAKNSDQIQRVVAATRSIFRYYIDASDPYNKQLAMSKLFNQASTVSKLNDSTTKSDYFKQCTQTAKK